MTPAQIRQAYGVNNITLSGGKIGDGTGITVAIVDAGNDPTIVSDLHAFDLAFGLADPPSFKIVNQNGSSNPAFLPEDDPGVSVETSLDVEWVHAIAPKANILLVESDDILGAINYARSAPNVSVVSISYGIGPVFVPGTNSQTEFMGESSADFVFTTPSGHQGVSFTVSAGDTGGPAEWPSTSPNVLSVGGTKLTLTKTNGYLSEVVWNEGLNGGAGGGGVSGAIYTNTSGQIFISNNAPLPLEPSPSYQSGLGFKTRATPDVSFDSDPASGYAVYDSFAFGATTPWEIIGGTSAAAPAWAGLIAIADQGRAAVGKSSLANVQSVIYKLPAADFHDITAGNNDMFGQGLGITGNAAKAGYDLASGRGTPIANLVIRDLIAYNGNTAFSIPSSPNASINAESSLFFAKSKFSGDESALNQSMTDAITMSDPPNLDLMVNDTTDLANGVIAPSSASVPSEKNEPAGNTLQLVFESNDADSYRLGNHHSLQHFSDSQTEEAFDRFFATTA
jgi:subtilase family serine protease